MRAIFSLMAVLVLFLGLFGLMVISRQEQFVLDLEKRHAADELDLIGTLAREALIKRDYVTVEQFFSSWGLDNPDIVSIRADAPNGFSLALYEREKSAAHFLKVTRDVHYAGKKLISMALVRDLSEVHLTSARVRIQSAAGLALFTLATGVVLWFTLRRTAILPMERLIQEVEKLNLGLEQRVMQRTTDLISANEALRREMGEREKAEENLRVSKEELERQNKELRKLDTLKDALIRDISHELKTPVAKHLMQLEIMEDILKRTGGLDDARDVLQVMELGIRRQEATIRNILLMSRLEGGGRSPNFAVFALDEFIEEVVEDYMHAIATYGIRLRMDLTAVKAFSDRELLWHVMANLIHNAIKYRSLREPHLQIRTVQEGDTIRILVADNGRGFTRKEREQAFRRFYQSSPSVEGVGLGLNIAKTIAESLGGSIEIESAGRDKGTTVTVALPVARESRQESVAEGSRENQ
jgi:signal transduction histidine kinase